MKKLFLGAMFTIIFIAGCTEQKPIPKNVGQNQLLEVSVVPTEEIEIVATQLSIPWSIEKQGDTFYISERTGSIAKIEKGQVERQRVELTKPLATVTEAGLLGFVLAPDFPQSNQAYAYYTYQNDAEQFNRIVTLKLENNVWREQQVLLDGIPSGRVHHGGRLKIGPDHKLYATVGDAANSALAQDRNSLAGKILRLNLDGTVPNDNPFPNSYVYSYGHRNPQGITWAPDGKLYESEHGNQANDEINEIVAGQNFGWPMIEGFQQREGMVTPIFTSGINVTWAPSGMDEHEGKLYVAALRGNAVLEFNLETMQYREIITGLGRIRDIYIEDDSLYFISNNTDGRGEQQQNDDKLYRISLSQLNN